MTEQDIFMLSLTLLNFLDFSFQELRSFTLEVEVDPKYHPKIIGRQGAVISKIRRDHDVQIKFPERGCSAPEIIKITGYETNTESAKKDIERIVTDLVSQ